MTDSPFDSRRRHQEVIARLRALNGTRSHNTAMLFAAYVYGHSFADPDQAQYIAPDGYSVLFSAAQLRDLGVRDYTDNQSFDAALYYDPISDTVYLSYAGSDDLADQARMPFGGLWDTNHEVSLEFANRVLNLVTSDPAYANSNIMIVAAKTGDTKTGDTRNLSLKIGENRGHTQFISENTLKGCKLTITC